MNLAKYGVVFVGLGAGVLLDRVLLPCLSDPNAENSIGLISDGGTGDSLVSLEEQLMASDSLLNVPSSTSTESWESVGPSPLIRLAKNRILVDGDEVMLLDYDQTTGVIQIPEEGMDPGYVEVGQHSYLPALAAALAERRSHFEHVNDANPQMEFEGEILLQVDREVPFDVLRSVLFTAGQEQFGELRFVVHNPTSEHPMIVPMSLPAIGHPMLLDPDIDAMCEGYFGIDVVIDSMGIGIDGSCPVREALGRSCTVPRPSENLPLLYCMDARGEPSGCTSTEDYDWQGLAELLVRIKNLAMSQVDHSIEEAFISLESVVSYETIVRALDVVRDGAGLVDLDPSWLPLASEAGIGPEAESGSPVLFPVVLLKSEGE